MKQLKFSIAFSLIVTQLSAQNVLWTSSTSNDFWNQSTIKITGSTSKVNDATIIVFPDRKLQQMDGFGGCFNELGWDALNLVSEKEQQSIINNLFDEKECNFTLNRMPIGANDYARNYYSLNDSKGDFLMKQFTIERDKQVLIPYIKKALSVAPDMRIFASPWCPPAWMKVNEHYASASYDRYNDKIKTKRFNDLPETDQAVFGTTSFKMLTGYLEAYALYFSKFIEAYKNEGINNIFAIHVQNEPVADQIFPSCLWRAEDLAYFIGEYLGPRMAADHKNVEIWFGTINSGDFNFVKTAMSNNKARKYIKGVGFQWAGKNAIAETQKTYPDLNLMQTESECGDGSNNWKSAEHTWDLINHYLTRGARSYIYWNLILENGGVSNWGWVQNSLITIDKQTKQIVYNPEFYLMKQLSHFVKQGAYRLETARNKDYLAFQNPDGKIIVVYYNAEDKDKTIQVAVNESLVKVTVKAKSFNTFSI